MLVLKLEIWPNGNKKRARTLGVMQMIWTNDDLLYGDYDVNFYADHEPENPYEERGLTNSGKIKKFQRPLGAWQLVLRALKLMVRERKDINWGPNDFIREDGHTWERDCEHGRGHSYKGQHGCDGCCGKPGFFE